MRKEIEEKRIYKSMMFVLFYISVITLIYNTLENNGKFRIMMIFLIVFNSIYMIFAYGVLSYNSKLKFNLLNINIITLILGCLYNIVFFSYFELDIIYYLSIKDYLLSSAYIFVLFLFLTTFIYGLKNLLWVTMFKLKMIIQVAISMLVFLIYLLIFILLLKCLKVSILNISSIWIILLAILNMSIVYYICEYLKNKNFFKSETIKITFLLLLLTNITISVAYIESYKIIGYSEKKLEKYLKAEDYKGIKIFKLKSFENYEFYISKPANKLIIKNRKLQINMID